MVLRKWSQNNKTTRDLAQFRSKVAAVIGIENDSRVTDEEIVIAFLLIANCYSLNQISKVEMLNAKKSEISAPKDPNAEKHTMVI